TSYPRTQELREAGRIPEYQVDQGRQQVLSADDSRVLAQAQLRTAVDRFKLTLGLPVDVDLKLDPSVIATFRDLRVAAVTLDADAAIELALARRLDLRNVRERLDDAARQVRIAEQNLLMDLNLHASVAIPNGDSGKPLALDWDRSTWELGLDADLPFNRVP